MSINHKWQFEFDTTVLLVKAYGTERAWSERMKFLDQSGCYGVLIGGKCVYVGASAVSVANRIQFHTLGLAPYRVASAVARKISSAYKAGRQITIGFTPLPSSEVFDEELVLIKKLRPRCNIYVMRWPGASKYDTERRNGHRPDPSGVGPQPGRDDLALRWHQP